jgi:hypothetical protein
MRAPPLNPLWPPILAPPPWRCASAELEKAATAKIDAAQIDASFNIVFSFSKTRGEVWGPVAIEFAVILTN